MDKPLLASFNHFEDRLGDTWLDNFLVDKKYSIDSAFEVWFSFLIVFFFKFLDV